MSYQILFTDIALKNLKKYPQKDRTRILSKIEELAEDPLHTPNVKQLVNFSPSYRLRVGDYRVLFEREDTVKIIEIIDILQRSKTYRRRR
jgi:mRNA interferase RelE/StbE